MFGLDGRIHRLLNGMGPGSKGLLKFINCVTLVQRRRHLRPLLLVKELQARLVRQVGTPGTGHAPPTMARDSARKLKGSQEGCMRIKSTRSSVHAKVFNPKPLEP